MQNINLATAGIWSFGDESGDTIRLSLPDILRADISLYHCPGPGFLAPIQHELLASILQFAIDSLWPRGLGKRQYQKLIHADQVKDVQPVVKSICRRLKQIEGFNLFGCNAFMQMPSTWRKSGKLMGIGRLLWPFIPNPLGAAKGLRCMAPLPTCLAPDLTALFLYTSCCFPKGGTQFWTIGNLAGRAVLHEYRGKTLRQQLFSAVLPGSFPDWKPAQPLPWVSRCLNNGGLEDDDRPPCRRYLQGNKRIKGTANLRFFQARGMVLEPPEKGICDISGQPGMVFKGYYLLTDEAVYRNIVTYGQPRRDLKYAGILGRMYEKIDHSSVAGKSKNQDTDKKDFSLPCHGHTIPGWYATATCLDYPTTTIQAVRENNPQPVPAPEPAESSFFLVKYSTGKQDVRGLYHYQHCNFQDPERARKLTDMVDEAIGRLKSGKKYLLKAARQKNNHLDDFADSALLDSYQQLWNTADLLYSGYGVADESGKDWEPWAAVYLDKTLRQCWQRIIEEHWSSRSLSIVDRRKECTATRMVLGEKAMERDRTYLDGHATVRAGRAFAREYYQGLGSTEKARLSHEITPVISRYFWQCLNKARREDPALYQPMFELALPLLQYILPVEDGRTLGDLLKSYSGIIRQDDVEKLFTLERSEDVVEQVQLLFKRIAAGGRLLSCDFGVFLYDLKQYGFSPETVTRRWAASFFMEQPQHQSEVENV